MFTKAQLEFIAELMNTKGLVLSRDRWEIAAETLKALSVALKNAETTDLPIEISE